MDFDDGMRSSELEMDIFREEREQQKMLRDGGFD